jgi:hypothetical protein
LSVSNPELLFNPSTKLLTVGGLLNSNGNGVGNIGSSGGYYNTVFATAMAARYADLAENYLADHDYGPGTVVVFGGSHEVTVADQPGDSKIAGVISTNPSYIMNSCLEGDHVVTVALVGRVPCKVLGPITKGNMLVSAGNGHAAASSTPAVGTIIGKALEDFSGDQGIIEIAVGRV